MTEELGSARRPTADSVLDTDGVLSMLKWTLIFLLISFVTGVVGFSTYASAAAKPARIMFFLAMAMVLVSTALTVFTVKGVFQ